MIKRPSAIAIALALAGLALALGGLLAPGPALAAGSPCAASVKDAQRYRESMGFSTDIALIQALNADPSADCKRGVPLSAAEVEELQRRARVVQSITALNDWIYGEAADYFGGLYIDQPAGGQIVLLTSNTPPDVLDQALGMIPDGVDYRVDEVAHSLGYLLRVFEEISERFSYSEWGVTSVAVHEKTSTVEVDIDAAHFQRTKAAIKRAYPDGLIEFLSGEPGSDTGGPPPTDTDVARMTTPWLPLGLAALLLVTSLAFYRVLQPSRVTEHRR